MANNGQATLEAGGRPRLQSFVRLQYDSARERWVLQAPERVLVLDETGKEIVDLCSGEMSVAEIVERLARDYDAPADVIAHDVSAVVRLLAEKNLLVIEAPTARDRRGDEPGS